MSEGRYCYAPNAAWPVLFRAIGGFAKWSDSVRADWHARAFNESVLMDGERWWSLVVCTDQYGAKYVAVEPRLSPPSNSERVSLSLFVTLARAMNDTIEKQFDEFMESKGWVAYNG